MLLLFDVDGTLMHSAGAGRAAIEVAMREVYGTAGPIEDLRFDGLTDPLIVRTLLRAVSIDDARIDAGLPELWSTYAGHLVRELEARRDRLGAAPGVPALLDRLDGISACLGLVTGNIAPGARHKLSACGLWRRFPFGAFGSDAEDRNALPPIALERARLHAGLPFAAEATWVIGDTPRDVACAQAAGLRCLAVATGSFTVEELAACGADVALESLVDTDAVLSVLERGAAA